MLQNAFSTRLKLRLKIEPPKCPKNAFFAKSSRSQWVNMSVTSVTQKNSVNDLRRNCSKIHVAKFEETAGLLSNLSDTEKKRLINSSTQNNTIELIN